MTSIPPGYVPQSPDTSPEVEARVFDRLRAMTPAERLRQADAAIRFAEEVATAGIRSRHPGASAQEVRMRLLAQRLDRATMVRVYGWDPDREGA